MVTPLLPAVIAKDGDLGILGKTSVHTTSFPNSQKQRVLTV
jgi:hypothetical protein